MANFLPIETRQQIFHLLCEGNGTRTISRLTGRSTNTVQEIRKRYTFIVDFLNRKYLRQHSFYADEVEADEIKTYVRHSDNVRWIYISLDRSSRVVINFHIGNRDEKDAKIFLQELNYRLANEAQVSTDSLISYIAAVKKTPYGRIDSSVSCINLLRSKHSGKKLGRGISNRVETQNGNVRQHVSALGRRTRCFSKSEAGMHQLLSLYFFYYNFIKIHKSLKTCPAVAAGLVEAPITFDAVLEYDMLFTETFTHVDKNNWGKAKTRAIVKQLSDMDKEDFLNEISYVDGMKRGTNRTAYKKKAKVVGL